MKMEEKFLSAIGDIEDDFISEAAACTPAAVKKPKNLWLRYGCLAACLVTLCRKIIWRNCLY